MVINLPHLFEEVEINSKNGMTGLDGWKDRLLISSKAHLTFDFHRIIDGQQEASRGTKKYVGREWLIS